MVKPEVLENKEYQNAGHFEAPDVRWVEQMAASILINAALTLVHLDQQEHKGVEIVVVHLESHYDL